MEKSKTLVPKIKNMMKEMNMNWIQICHSLSLKKIQMINNPELADLSHWGFSEQELDELYAFDWQNEWEILTYKCGQ